MHPIVLRNDGRTLVAGERRLRAMLHLSNEGRDYTFQGEFVRGHAPFVRLAELTHDQLVEAELHENTIRLDLSWQERAQAVANLNALRASQSPTHSTTALATELGTNQIGVRHSLLLAQHMADPDIGGAETEQDAVRIMRKKLEQKLRGALGDSLATVVSPHTLLQGDCLPHLSTMPAASFDIICSDPPYGIGADTDFSVATDISHTYADGPAVLDTILRDVVPQLTRVAKPDAHAYFFCSIVKFGLWVDALTSNGWSVWPYPLIWYRSNSGTCPNPTFGFRHNYDAIVAARRVPGRALCQANTSDVLAVPQESNLVHAARKPVALYEALLAKSSRPGDTVLDPFCGSGPVFAAAKRLSLVAVGIELDEQMCSIARNDLSDLYR